MPVSKIRVPDRGEGALANYLFYGHHRSIPSIYTMESEKILQCEQISKTFLSGEQTITVLQDVSFSLRKGESCAVYGPSGSGKSTLLSLAAGLDRPTVGRVLIAGRDLAVQSEDQLALLRSEKIGFVFQNYQLIPSLTALENILLPVELRGRELHEQAELLLEKVGLSSRRDHYPSKLSGGEQQRVALARAFINRPSLLLADEPTGSLDKKNAEIALELMFRLNADYGASLLLVTHDMSIVSRIQRSIHLEGGRIVAEN